MTDPIIGAIPQSTDPQKFANPSSFCFKQRYGKLNWFAVKNLDFNQIVETGDIELLQSVLENITYSTLDREDLEKFNDSSMIKMFKLSQLTVEYLMNSQNILYAQSSQLDTKYQNFVNQRQILEEQAKKNEIELNNLKKDVTSKRKSLSTYEYLLRQPAVGAMLQRTLAKANSVQCAICGKNFASQAYLDQHILKRHGTTQAGAEKSAKEESVQSAELLNIIKLLQESFAKNIEVINGQQADQFKHFKDIYEAQITDLKKSQLEIEETRLAMMEAASKAPAEPIVIQAPIDNDPVLQEARLTQKLLQEQLLENQRRNEEMIGSLMKRIDTQAGEQQAVQSLANQWLEKKEKKSSKVEVVSSSPRGSGNIKHEEDKKPSVVVTPTPGAHPKPEVERVRTPSPPKAHQVKIKLDAEVERPKAPKLPESPERPVTDESKVSDSLQRPKTTETIESNAGDLEVDSETANDSLNTTVVSIDRPTLLEEDEINNIAQSLGIKERMYHFIAKEKAVKPLPDQWREQEDKYVNKETGEVTNRDPGFMFYKARYEEIKEKDSKWKNEIESFCKPHTSSILSTHFKSGEGIPTFFKYDQKKVESERHKVTVGINELSKMINIESKEKQILEWKAERQRELGTNTNASTLLNDLQRRVTDMLPEISSRRVVGTRPSAN